MSQPMFEADDLAAELPPPGFYRSQITHACFRRSVGGNWMLQVVHALRGVPAQFQRVAEYFVFEGATAHGLALARRRLIELYRVCGLEPAAGTEIRPAELEGAELDVRVAHDEWEGQPRLRVMGHRRPDPRLSDGVPF